ncbi:MAG: DUF1326 domain-containing protein [Terriglobia bacterium]
MKLRGLILSLTLVLALPALAPAAQIAGDYIEVRTADVYTGPCFANSEIGLTGTEAVLAWRIREGSWDNVALAGLSVVAVVRASATLGDPYADSLPAKALLIVDARASAAQRAALVSFVRAQTDGLLSDIVTIESSPIQFAVDEQRHGYATVEAANLAKISTRAIGEADRHCYNEEVFYQPLAANLNHAVPAVALDSGYRGNHLGITWREANRRGSFVATFAF